MSHTANKAAIAGFVFVLGVTLSAPVSAQRGTGARGHVPVVHAPARVGTPMNPNFAPISRVPGAAPGLGFDFEHLAAVSRPSANQRRNGRRQQFITPVFFDGGLPLYYPSYLDNGTGYENNLEPEPQPSVVIVQQPPQTIVMPPTIGQNAGTPAQVPPPANAAPEVPVPDIGQFILMRRDGQVSMAAAFTVSGDRLTYITREGTRRSFPVAELDTEATRQMNDANGTTFKLPR